MASQNPPETHPKSFQNRCLRKHTIFHRFLRDFCCLLQEPTSKKRAPTQCFVNFSHNSVYRFEHTFSVQKTYQKPFQNEVRTLPKSMTKTCCFLTSIVSGLELILEGLGLPSWSQVERLGLPAPSQKPPKSNLLGRCAQDAAQEGPRWLPRSPRRRFFGDF